MQTCVDASLLLGVPAYKALTNSVAPYFGIAFEVSLRDIGVPVKAGAVSMRLRRLNSSL